MASRCRVDKNKSSIIFDITGGEKNYQSMTLQTVPVEHHIIRTQNENFSLRTDDIDGARAKPFTGKLRNTFYDTTDIEGSSPQNSYDITKPPFDIMGHDDIEGSKPRIRRNMPHSNRHTNPLNPNYELPKTKQEPPPELPFIRDNINYDDIPGVHPRSYKPVKPARDIMKVSDIEGAHPTHRNREIRESHNRQFDVSDINNDGDFHSKRHTDPLDPQFQIYGEILENDFGKSHSNYLVRKGQIDYSLQTQDIEGAQADTSTLFYRTYRPPKPIDEKDENTHPAPTSVELPSMILQGPEIEHQKQVDHIRAEKIRMLENRHLQKKPNVDPIQGLLREQRKQRNNY